MHNFTKIEDFNGHLYSDELMSKHSSYKIGGPASYFAVVNDVDSLVRICSWAKNHDVTYQIIGRGTNLLFSDKGYDGLIIVLDGDFNKFEYDDNTYTYTVGAAVSLSKLVSSTKKNFYKGFEFAVGTPGSIGGAIRMNAGTKTDWISDRVLEVCILNKDLEVEYLKKEDIQWSYRSTSIKNDEIILSAKFIVEPLYSTEEQNNLIFNMEEKLKNRRKTQPLKYPSCGSVFKNPEGYSAGQLIEKAGFKSKKIGDAQVSDVHCNFIVNLGCAKACDVVALILEIQEKVYKTKSIKLVPEVKFVGFDTQTSLF